MLTISVIVKIILTIMTLLVSVIAYFFKRLVNNIDRLTIVISDLQVELSDFQAKHKERIKVLENDNKFILNKIDNHFLKINEMETSIAILKLKIDEKNN